MGGALAGVGDSQNIVPRGGGGQISDDRGQRTGIRWHGRYATAWQMPASAFQFLVVMTELPLLVEPIRIHIEQVVARVIFEELANPWQEVT